MATQAEIDSNACRPRTGQGNWSAYRVTFLTIMPSPYTCDLFDAVAADGRIESTVLYMEMAAPDTLWGSVALPGYARVLHGGWRSIGGGRVHWNPGTPKTIAASRPDVVVVSGYSSLTSQVVMRWLRRRGVPWIFWGEVPGMRSLKGLKARLRSLAMRPALQWPSAIAGIGTGAVEQYRQHSRPGCPVANIPYHTDLSKFSGAERTPQACRVRVLYCGQLIARKGVIPLLEAFSKVAREIPNLELMLVGEGELKANLQRSLGDDIRDRVHFAGFHPVKELPAFFAAADIFVLPSLHDGWGVVVNQALAAGLPIIVSDAVGAAADLVTAGWNGEIVPAGNAAALEQAFRKLGSDSALRRQYGENSRTRSADWTPARGVDRWVDLITNVLSSSKARGGSAS